MVLDIKKLSSIKKKFCSKSTLTPSWDQIVPTRWCHLSLCQTSSLLLFQFTIKKRLENAAKGDKFLPLQLPRGRIINSLQILPLLEISFIVNHSQLSFDGCRMDLYAACVQCNTTIELQFLASAWFIVFVCNRRCGEFGVEICWRTLVIYAR